jgi:hypothetical protein
VTPTEFDVKRKAGTWRSAYPTVYHIVRRGEQKALCGTKPASSSHWASYTPPGKESNCRKCLEKLGHEGQK